ncbi:hypothetical protein V4V35_25370 [Bacillus infantis]|uniref:hypothetical protein n=1 Tax=Bacillus infantis TaxID=324767 RepID=UPI002FBEDE11
MNNVGFIIKNRSHGKEYFYLRKSVRIKNSSGESVPRNVNIFSFGTREKALEDLNRWKNGSDELPLKLQQLGYGKNDVEFWINEIEKR